MQHALAACRSPFFSWTTPGDSLCLQGVLCAWRRWAVFGQAQRIAKQLETWSARDVSGQDKDDEEDTAAANASLPTERCLWIFCSGAKEMVQEPLFSRIRCSELRHCEIAHGSL